MLPSDWSFLRTWVPSSIWFVDWLRVDLSSTFHSCWLTDWLWSLHSLHSRMTTIYSMSLSLQQEECSSIIWWATRVLSLVPRLLVGREAWVRGYPRTALLVGRRCGSEVSLLPALLFCFPQKQEGRFNEPRARFYFGEIILALDYLHSFGIVFR